MKNGVQKGYTIEVTAAADVVSGQLGKHGAFVGVYSNTVSSGAQVSLEIEGVFNLTKKTASEVIAVGDPIYKVAGEDTVRKTSAQTDFFIGIATKASGNGTTTVDVKLERNFSVAVP